MKHLSHARIHLQEGESHKALEIIENVLALAPENPEAMRLKAEVLEGWGRFDEASKIIQAISKLRGSFALEARDELKRRFIEERDSLFHTRLSDKGRVYNHFSLVDLWVSIFGVFGCLIFLALLPYFSNVAYSYIWLYSGFFILVICPFFILLHQKMTRLSAVTIGPKGILIHKRGKATEILWDSVRHVTIEYDYNISLDYLVMKVFIKGNKIPLPINISRQSPDIKGRRHFTRAVISYVDSYSYTARGREELESSFIGEITSKELSPSNKNSLS